MILCSCYKADCFCTETVDENNIKDFVRQTIQNHHPELAFKNEYIEAAPSFGMHSETIKREYEGYKEYIQTDACGFIRKLTSIPGGKKEKTS